MCVHFHVDSGFTGSFCETDINECLSNPCYFGGTCTDVVNGFICDCAEGYIGERCEAVIRVCPLDTPCGDHGICIAKPLGRKTNTSYMSSYIACSNKPLYL